MPRETIPLAQAAHKLNLSRATLCRSLEQGLIRGQKRDDGWHVEAGAVAQILQDQDLRLDLPLTLEDILCAGCGERLPNCPCPPA